MLNFIKEYKRTILFIVFVAAILAGIFIYRRVQLNKGTYEPNHENVSLDVIKYEENEYTVMYMNKTDVYRAYYKAYVRLLLNDPVKAYGKLTDACRKEMFNNDYDKFLDFTKKLDRKALMVSDLARYSEQDGKIILIDTNESSFVLYEKGVWNYEVFISGRMD